MIYFGLDLGRRRDYSALVAVEWTQEYAGLDVVSYEHRYRKLLEVRGVERLPRGMTYPEVVSHVRRLVRDAGEESVLVVDGTGVGVAVVDLLRKEQLPSWLRPVTITGGSVETQRDGFCGVPRSHLMGGLRASFESGEVRIASKSKHSEALITELLDLRDRGTKSTDDLVFALALARWAAAKQRV